jgi:hypothetical protein
MTFDPGWAIKFLKGTHGVVGGLIPYLLGIALLVFVWGVVKFMMSDDDNARNEGKRRIVWGIVGLFVIVSIWGLVQLVGTLMGINKAKVFAPQRYFDTAPGSGPSAGFCKNTTDLCPDGSGSTCASPCCQPWSGLDPDLCLNAGD